MFAFQSNVYQTFAYVGIVKNDTNHVCKEQNDGKYT